MRFKPDDEFRRLELPSTFNIGRGTIIALGNFVMPFPGPVFPGDAGGLARLLLFRCRGACSSQGCIMIWKSFGEHVADLIGPTAIMLDNHIGNPGHGELLYARNSACHKFCASPILSAAWPSSCPADLRPDA